MQALGEFDFAIVGGGLVGMSLAYGLARRGPRVVVLDEGDRAFRASRGNFALVWQQGKGIGLPDYARWTRRSVRLWPALAADLRAETGIDVRLDQRGGFLLALDEADLAARGAEVAALSEALGNDPIPFEVMGRSAIAAMLPAIGPEVVGGTFCPLDGHVDALRFFNALSEACHRLGASYRPGAPVTAIRPGGGGFVVATAAGAVAAERVVLAAGLGNARLAPMLGLDAPVRPERGQILVTEKLEPFLDYPLGTLRQTDEGAVMIGASNEDAGFDARTGIDVLAALASDAVRMFPLLARARIVRTWAALRVMSPDGFPIYDASRDCPGAFVVTCHSGVTLAAAHALELAPGLAAGAFPRGIEAFSARRLRDVPQAA